EWGWQWQGHWPAREGLSAGVSGRFKDGAVPRERPLKSCKRSKHAAIRLKEGPTEKKRPIPTETRCRDAGGGRLEIDFVGRDNSAAPLPTADRSQRSLWRTPLQTTREYAASIRAPYFCLRL